MADWVRLLGDMLICTWQAALDGAVTALKSKNPQVVRREMGQEELLYSTANGQVRAVRETGCAWARWACLAGGVAGLTGYSAMEASSSAVLALCTCCLAVRVPCDTICCCFVP